MTPPADRTATPAVPSQRPRLARPDRLSIDGVGFDAMTEEQTSAYVLDCLDAGRGGVLVTPNVDILRILRLPEGQEVARRADVVVADGMPVVWASRLAGDAVPERVAGSSLVRTLARDAAWRGRSLYLLGGPPRAAEVASANLRRRYPGLRIAGHSCPKWGFQDRQEDWDEVVAHLRETQPDIVYLALGSPKQEKIGFRLHELFPQTWFLGCGASVTFLAGFIPQAPMWMQRSGLEWVHRLSKEPRRLWRRYLVDDIPYALGLMARSARAGRARRR